MVTIAGVVTHPSTFQAGVMDITKAARNADGDMIIEKITTKRKLELSYNYMSSATLSTLLTAIAAAITFMVTYPDPVTGAARSGTFYVGDRTSEAIDYIGSVIRYKNLKFNLIEV